MDREKALLHELMSLVKDMLRNTEVAVRSFTMLCPRFVHLSSGGGTSSVTAPSRAPGATVAPGSNAQSASASVVPVFDFYSGLPKKPSPFLQRTVARFEKYLGECRQWIEELEQLLLLDCSDRNGSGFGSSLVDSLPKVMSNVHDFFVHVAAKVSTFNWTGLLEIRYFPWLSCMFDWTGLLDIIFFFPSCLVYLTRPVC